MNYCCFNCKKTWNHVVDKCIFCGQRVVPVDEKQYNVTGWSEVFVPSTGNEKTPYFIYFLEDSNGNKKIEKTTQKFKIGDVFNELQKEEINEKIGVIGSGLLGSQIALYLIQYKYPTILKTRTTEGEKNALLKIQQQLSKRMSEDDTNITMKNLTLTTKYADLADCDIIIEAATEDINVKKAIFKEISSICKPSTIFATNSSSLSIDDLASVTDRPQKCIGMHFFNPVHRMDLVEVVIGKDTSPLVVSACNHFITKLAKKPITVRNNPGYVVNRLLLPQINEAIYLLEDGVASKEDIDSAVKLGLNHPMGPFQLADLIGLDVCLSILEVLSSHLEGKNYSPAPLLYSLVGQGKLGIKSGEGFYSYGSTIRN